MSDITKAADGNGHHPDFPDAPRSLAPLPAVFDEETAILQCFGSREMLDKMIRYLFEETEKLLPQLQTAFSAGNFEDVSQIGHQLKGTLVYLAARPAEQAAIRVEQLRNVNNSTADAREAIENLTHQCSLLRTALAEHVVAREPA